MLNVAVASPHFSDPPQKSIAVSVFWCGDGRKDCEIVCYVPGHDPLTISGLNAARVFKYPNSEKLWLETDLPNQVFYLGGAFCDFNKMPIERPLD
jgi:hypothetical protein